MAHQSSDLGLGQRVRAAMAVTVAVFALSLSYWGVLVRQESQASTTNNNPNSVSSTGVATGITTINFDDKPSGNISGTAYPDLTITSNGQSRAALYPIDNPACPGFRYPSSPNALYIPQDTAGGNSILNITFAGGKVSDTVSLQLVHYTTTVNIKVEALDSSGAVVDTKMTNPPGGNGCANTPFTLSSGTSTGIASIRMAAVQPEAGPSWGVDDFSYSALHLPVSNFGFSVTPLTGSAPLTVTVTYTGQGGTIPLNWDFGDGQVVENGSTTLTHTYTSVGTYPIKLTSGTFVAQNTVIVSAAIPLPTPLSFSVTPMTGVAPLTITGSSLDSATAAAITHSWNWGDSSAPTLQQPVYTNSGNTTATWPNLTHIYNAAGSYLVTVTQIEGIGTANPVTQTAQKTIVVTANTTNDATLTTSKSVYDVGELVQFTLTNIGSNILTLANTAPFNITSGTTTVFSPIGGQVVTQLAPSKPQSWTWDQKNTTSAQVAEGVYTVTVSYSNGSEAKTKSTTFTVTKQATAPTFTYKVDPTSGTAPLTVKATVTGTGADATAPIWDFGDGTTATGVSVSHTYATGGTYSATVRIGSQVGTQQVIVSNAIVNASPTPTSPKKLAQTGLSLSLVLLISLLISGVLSYLIIRRPFHESK